MTFLKNAINAWHIGSLTYSSLLLRNNDKSSLRFTRSRCYFLLFLSKMSNYTILTDIVLQWSQILFCSEDTVLVFDSNSISMEAC